jgi:hypothetical protein
MCEIVVLFPFEPVLSQKRKEKKRNENSKRSRLPSITLEATVTGWLGLHKGPMKDFTL